MCCHDDIYSVYYHKNNINGKIYVGKAKSIAKRWGHNGNGYTVNRDTIFANAIKKYGWDNFEHVIVADGLSDTDACDVERHYIDLWKTNICKYGNDYGYNMTDGGDGSPGASFGCKCVYCITTGELYPSVSIAAEQNGISVTHLTAVCKGRKKSAHGLLWRYASDEDILHYNQYGNPVFAVGEREQIVDDAASKRKEQLNYGRFVNSNKPVECIELGLILPSIRAAALFAHTDIRNISQSVNAYKKGSTMRSAGYHWRFAEMGDSICKGEGGDMQGRFIYVFSSGDRDKLLSQGFNLLKSNEAQNVYVFSGSDDLKFSDDIAFVFSDTLTF